jgi:hypothetical protein
MSDCFSSIKKSKQVKNQYVILDNNTAILYITRKGQQVPTKVDIKHLPMIQQFNWFIMGQTETNQGYVGFSRKAKGKTSYYKLHRLILGIEDESVFVDHINRDRFDNREDNLRIATRFQNAYNGSKYKGTINTFKGVRKTSSGKYECNIRANGKTIYLGTFLTELEAAKVYDENARFYHGEFAATNVSLGLVTEEELRNVLVIKNCECRKIKCVV